MMCLCFVLLFNSRCHCLDWPQLAVMLKLWIQVSTENQPEKQSKLGFLEVPLLKVG